MAFLSKGQTELWLWPQNGEAPTSLWPPALRALDAWFQQSGHKAWLLERIDSLEAVRSPWVHYFTDLGFTLGERGLLKRKDPGVLSPS